MKSPEAYGPGVQQLGVLLVHKELASLPCFFSIVYATKLGRTASRLNSRNIMYKIATNWENDSPLAEETGWE